jgi:hypothetical protein
MRNIIKLSEKEVLALLCDYDVQVEIEHEVIEDNIIRTDYEDGGGHHEYIIKNIKSGKFYKGYYTDWDIDNTNFDEDEQKFYRCDLDTSFIEVKSVNVIVTKYVEL